ncbi:MAG: hypothetical protein AAFX93_04365 [Verrucomicrobiota bacterium]
MRFRYQLENGPTFSVESSCVLPGGLRAAPVAPPVMDSLVFHFGLVQLISYWKSACPPIVEIAVGSLDTWQIAWWKKLFFRGLSEFFFVNGIEANEESLVDFRVAEKAAQELPRLNGILGSDAVMIPVGGGKDSALTMELLGERPNSVFFAINPIPAALKCIREFDPELRRTVSMEYRIDPQLLTLNQENYLNGHTPFSALVAFGTAIAAALAGTPQVALSNESSASEGNTEFGGFLVNHQYSKSLEFECDYREYAARYLLSDYSYFSLLRPLNEIQIAQAFSELSRCHQAFISCNLGGRQDRWCGECAKCLFTYVMLSAFWTDEQLFAVFKKDLFEDEELIPELNALMGYGGIKPLDCVGTAEEVHSALALALDLREGELPPLLRHFRSIFASYPVQEDLLLTFAEHRVPGPYLDRLKQLFC